MTTRICLLIAVCMFLTSIGCGKRQPAEAEMAAAMDESPLTVEQWKALGSHKFDLTNLERLRASDKKWEDQDAWDEFMKDVVTPELKREGGPTIGKSTTKAGPDPSAFEPD